MSARDDVTLEQVDAALKAAREQDVPVDDVALLWALRAELTGVRLQAGTLVHLMGVSLQEAEDIIARLSERGLIDQVEPSGDES